MQELLTQLSGYLNGVWRFRWFGLVLAWLIAISGWVWVSQLPEKYESRARVHIDTNSLLRPLLRGLAVQPDIRQRVALVSQTLLSRPNMDKLIRMADLDLAINTDSEKEKLIQNLEAGIQFNADRGNPSLYSIAFTHQNRDSAQRIVQSLITIFIEDAMGASSDDGGRAQEFLVRQIADYEARMSDAEARLAEFKQRHVGAMPGEAGDYYARLAAARSQLTEVRLRLREMENRQHAVRRQLQDLEEDGEWEFGFGELDDSQMASSYDSRILALEGKKDHLLMKYTERHPEVIQLRSLIEELEGDKQRELEELAVSMEDVPTSGLQASPVYQQMRGMLSETEAGVAELRVRAGEYERRVRDMTEAVDNVPLIEAEFKKLNRDYSTIASQHAALLSRRESAHMTEEVKQRGTDVKFRVIDPPFSPQRPTEPKVLLLNSAVLGGAIPAGFAFAFVLSLFKPLVSNQRMLGEMTGLPVFGSVPLVQSPAEKREALKQTLVFCLSVFSLFIVLGSLSFKYALGMA